MRSLTVLAAVACLCVDLAGLELTLDRRAIEEAISVGQSRLESVRAGFHVLYRVPVSQAPIDYLEVVTPFRRVELGAEARSRAGGGIFGLTEAEKLLAAATDEVWVYVELTFHPLNTMVGMPDYGVTLTARSVSVEPLGIERIPRSGPRVEGLQLPSTPSSGALIPPRGSQPVTGGTLVARFAGARLELGVVYDVLVLDGTKTLGRGKLDLSRMR